MSNERETMMRNKSAKLQYSNVTLKYDNAKNFTIHDYAINIAMSHRNFALLHGNFAVFPSHSWDNAKFRQGAINIFLSHCIFALSHYHTVTLSCRHTFMHFWYRTDVGPILLCLYRLYIGARYSADIPRRLN